MPTINPILTFNAIGDEVKAIQSTLLKVGASISVSETTAASFGTETVAAVKQFQASVNLRVTGAVDVVTQSMLNNAAAVACTGQSHVSGQLMMDYGLPANGVTVRLYAIGYGGAATPLAEAKTDPNGVYSLPYKAPSAGANIQVRAVDSQGKETPVSAIVYEAPAQKPLNLVAPASVQPLGSEFQRLAASVQGLIGGNGIQNLAKAQESDTQRDLTLLTKSTGWDARLLALAAIAVQQTATTGLGPDVLYALYRAGLPTDPSTLALVPAATIGATLQKAAQAGIVNLQADQIASAQTTFTAYAAKTNLARTAAGAPSSFNDLLGSVLPDAGQQAAFAGTFFDATNSGADLWSKAAAAGVAGSKIAALQLQGKLAYLTYNNAGLVQALQQKLGEATDAAVLVDQDFHLDKTWIDTLNGLADGNQTKLQALIPATYGGATAADQLEAYAADMARKVRVSFPTRVLARMAETTLNLDPKLAPKVGAFLRAADTAGYQAGQTPLNVFLKNLPSSVPTPDQPTIDSAKTLHRLYQVTPSNESLQSALKLGFSSARDIVAYTPDEFRARFGPGFPSFEEADLVYRKAQQVSTVTMNAFAIAKQLDTQPAMYAMGGAPATRQAARDAIVQKFPSMAGLFGSLDFCQCEDCRSVLSPAAYLVDILHFLDPDLSDWTATKTNWANAHNGQAYPFDTPFGVLTTRRPDLPNLNLSCDNTDKALPYIDAVNEILEYFVGQNGSLQNLEYDTGAANSADLIAEPQNILPGAYAILANQVAAKPAVYPLSLPFDLWIETVRGFLNYFKLPLGKILEVFRPAEPLELLPDANNYPYYWASIFVESLGFTPSEYALLTNGTSLANWFSLYGYSDQPTAFAALASAKTLADRLGITYQDLANLLETGFINASLVPLTIPLRKFGLSLLDVFTYTGQPGYQTPGFTPAQKAAFETKLQGLMQQYYPQSNPLLLQNWLNSTLSVGYSNAVLVFQAPAADGCDFQHTIFQYSGGNPASPLDFLKLNLFVRIWRKLNWSIDEVDRALQLFLAPWVPLVTDPSLGADLAKNGMPGALVYLSHLQALSNKLQPSPYGRAGLLPIWSNLATTGDIPLYAQLFLTDAVLNNDPIFDSPTGQYLSYFDTAQAKYLPFRWPPPSGTNEDPTNGYVWLGHPKHLATLQGALGLTAKEVASVLNDNGKDLNSAPLTLANVTFLYRYALLAQGLQISVNDLIALKQMCVDQLNTPPLATLNPFDPLSATPLGLLRDDHPWGETLQFADQASVVAASGFQIADLQYLLRHQVVDPAGPYQQDPAVMAQQLRALAAIIHVVQNQTTVPSDPAKLTDDLIRQKLSQVFPASVVQTFMGMWTGTIEYTATPVASPAGIPSDALADHPEVRLVYDSVLQTQTISLRGVPTSGVITALTTELGTLVTAGTITAAQQTTAQNLLSDIRTQAQTFFQTCLQQTSVGGQTTGFLQPADFDTLFSTPAAASTSRATLAIELFPFLRSQLISQRVIQFLAGQLGTNVSLTKTLLTNTAVLFDPTQAPTPPTPLLAAFEACGDSGLNVSYFSGNSEESPTILSSATVPTANTDLATNAAKPAGVNSARFEGYLEVPADGPYRFTAVLPNISSVGTLQFDFLTTPMQLSPSGVAQFKAGVLYHFTLDFQQLGGGDAKLLVEGEGLAQGPLSQLGLYPNASVARFERARILLAKILQLIQGFKLNENEVVYLASNFLDFGNLSFSALPTRIEDDSVSNAQKLFGQFLRLANYAELRKGPAGGTDGLLRIFQNARQTVPVTPLPSGVTTPLQLTSQNLYQAIAEVTRRDVETVASMIPQLWGTAAIQTTTNGSGASAQFQFTVAPLVNDLGFRRLWNALQMVQTLGVQPAVLQQTTHIAYPARATSPVDPDPGVVIASTLRNALKAQYSPDQWRPVAQSVFDPLRQKKRDALCDYILRLAPIQQFGAADKNGLFEYFLVDPGMEPVVQTSRIRLALSSVQTFIQRCLLNLEPQVNPSIINGSRWEWMKRYRVWEANREIFLWPENWLVPEYRENATDLFQALEGTLLQGNITQDLVEQAFTQYLQDLDTRARLDIISLFNQPPAAGDAATANTLHVIGRHHGKPTKYFYRTFANGIWNGWVPVTPDIEGDHVVAVFWRGRLTLFWLTFVIQGGPSNAADGSKGTTAPGITPSSNINQLSFGDLSTMVMAATPPKTIQIQLNWSEYYQGKWTPRKSSELNRFAPVPVADDFAPAKDILAHGSIDTDANGAETAVRIHLDFGKAYLPIFGLGGKGLAFRLTGKNSEPVCSSAYWQGRYYLPFATAGFDATKDVGYLTDPVTGSAGSPTFAGQYSSQLSTLSGVFQNLQSPTVPILKTVNSFNLLSCDNLPQLKIAGTTLTDLVYSLFTSQAAALGSPFFYEDTSDPNTNKELTFFVQPRVTETSVTSWLGWAIAPYYSDVSVTGPKYVDTLPLTSQVPTFVPPNPPDPEAIFAYQPNVDIVANESTFVSYGTAVIGRGGGTDAGTTFLGGHVLGEAGASGSLKASLADGVPAQAAGRFKLISAAGLDNGSAASFALRNQIRNSLAGSRDSIAK